MPVPTTFADLSTTVASNSPSGSETPGDGDNHLRTIYALLASIYGNSGNGWSSPYAPTSTTTSGTYTPTATMVTNMTSATAGVAQYIRIGNVVHVCGALTSVDVASSPATLSVIDLSLPISSNLAAESDLNGVGAMNWEATGVVSTVNIIANTTNDRASLRFFPLSDPASTKRLTYSFTYVVA